MNSTQISSKKDALDVSWANVQAVPGTQEMHCIRTIEPGIIKASRYSVLEGIQHELVPKSQPVVSEHDEAQVQVRAPEQPEEPSTVTQETVPTSAITELQIKVSKEKWYAVYWEPTGHWFLGKALTQTTESDWMFSFVHQTSPEVNLFKVVKDIDTVGVENIFATVNPPAGTSSRARLLKLHDDDYQKILEKYSVFIK